MNSTDDDIVHALPEFCGLETVCFTDSATPPPPPPPQWALLTLSVIPVWIVVGNGLVLLALLMQRHLQNMSNRVIASLAVTDFLLAMIVVPLSIYQLVRALHLSTNHSCKERILFLFFYKTCFLCFFILCVFFYFKNIYNILTWPKEP